MLPLQGAERIFLRFQSQGDAIGLMIYMALATPIFNSANADAATPQSGNITSTQRQPLGFIIDRQLYAKYGLSDEEVAFIEGMIKGM